MPAFLEHLAAICRALLAVPVSLLPPRLWDAGPLEALPVRRASVVSGLLTSAVGVILGGLGLVAHVNRAAAATIDATFEYTARQGRGQLPPSAPITTWDLQQFSVVAFFAFLLTPLGLFALYLIATGAVRAVSGWFDQPLGDPVVTGVDAAVRRGFAHGRLRRARAARAEAEGPEVPDRLFLGEWAGLEGVDYVLVSSRRKPGWTCGTFVITSDKWYTLGEPFDLELPQGLRTVYPLTEQKVTEVLRRGVPYELPPLGRGRRAPALLRRW